jgi:hypothetical protein
LVQSLGWRLDCSSRRPWISRLPQLPIGHVE